MKKGLLLSVVASGFIFAGGNIAPAAPVQPTVAPAACDFYGSIGARYEFKKNSSKANKWGKEDNTWKTTLVLGVNKELGYGFGLGAEVAATTDLGLNIATPKYGEDAELSQLFLTYKTGNTAIKAGRQALPKSLSPWAWTENTMGRLDNTFEGVVVVNTDVQDTTLVGAWIARAGDKASFGPVNGANNKGLFMLAAQYKGIANTTLTGSLYYVTKPAKTSVAWLSAVTKAGSVDLGLQAVYGKGSGTKATSAFAAFAGTNVNGLGIKLTGAYIKSGATPLRATRNDTGGFWGDTYAAFGNDIDGLNSKQKIAKLDLNYALPYGKLYGGVAYDKNSGTNATFSKKVAGRIGYKFKVSGVNAKIEYRYIKTTAGTKPGSKAQRVRVQGVYKF